MSQQPKIFGGAGNDTLTGTAGNDSLDGAGGNDTLISLAGSDTLDGDSGNDFLSGAIGSDSIEGEGGNDRLTGAGPTLGAGEVDILIGGAGADRFILGNSTSHFYDDGNAATLGAGDCALIADFNLSQDVIQLKGAAANYSGFHLSEVLRNPVS